MIAPCSTSWPRNDRPENASAITNDATGNSGHGTCPVAIAHINATMTLRLIGRNASRPGTRANVSAGSSGLSSRA